MAEYEKWMDCTEEEWAQGKDLAAPIKKLEVSVVSCKNMP